MYWIGDWSGVREKVYTDAVDYGLLCKRQDLEAVVKGLDRYLKKTKVRGAGLCRRFGVGYGIGSPGAVVRCWTEWMMDAGASKAPLSMEQGFVWHFELVPNRQFHVNNNGEAAEAWRFSDRKDIAYLATLLKHRWYYLRDGQTVYADSEEGRAKREDFFRGLLDSAGVPLERLYTYGAEEETGRIFR